MFPNVTGRDQSLKDKLKERKWQDRFTVSNGIPEYSPLKDKHTQSYRKLLNSSIQKQKYESTSSKQPQPKTYFQKKVQLFDRLKAQHPVYLSHLEQFQDFLTSSKLPNFYVYYSVLPLVNEIDVNGFILKVKKGIKEQTLAYYRIVTAIKVRQECLGSLRNWVSQFKPEHITDQTKKNQLKEIINHLRTLTVNAIDEIKRWRDSLNLKQSRAIYYFGDNENYLIKILNDNLFIFNSGLGEFANFAEKNDPFIIVPLKKAEGKQSNVLLQVLDTQKNIAYYQKYMEYLASQRAYQLSLIPVQVIKRESKYPQIEKVYKSKSIAKFDSTKKQVQQEFDHEAAQKQKLRQQRIKKNQEKINAIKNVYESYSSKLKLKELRESKKVDTDVEEKTKRERKASRELKELNKAKGGDEDFEKMVRNKLQKEKTKKLLFDEKALAGRQTKSMTKLPKTEDKIIENLKQIQSTLKSKLNFMQEQTKREDPSLKKMGLSGEKFQKKTNEHLISELKSQIIKNLQLESQERQLQRTKRRQQEEKAIEEIKSKMKRQMEQKLQQKKRQKLLQRQELQKKLKEQEQRLSKQRDLQLQLQVKLAKQKQLRELEKIKRQSLQKEMKFKQELEKQQKLRRQKEQTIERQRKQKQRLLEELKKKQLKEQLQKQIKQDMKSKYGQNPKLYDKDQLAVLRQQKQQQLTKQIQLLKLKQNEEIQQIRRENELRQRMIKLKKEEEELKRKQVQHLMKSVIQQEKEDLHRQAIKKRIQLEEEIKTSAKEKLLEQYKAEKQALLEKARLERQKQLQEDVYRQKIKEKIQKEMRIQAINRTKKQMEDRQSRRYEMSLKLENSKTKFNEVLQQDFNKQKIQQEVKKQLIEKVIFDKQAERQSAKNDLRAQFQRQLMASSLPQLYEAKQSDPIVKKNIQKFKGDDYLRNKLNQLQPVKPTNQKAGQTRQQMFESLANQVESPTKKSSINRNQSLINSITKEEKQIYEKKRTKVDEKRSQPSYKLPKKLSSQEEEGFELMAVEKESKQSEFDVKIIKKTSSLKKPEEQKEYKKKSKRRQQKDSEDESKVDRKKRSPKKKYESDEQDSEDQVRVSPNKKKISPKKRRQSDEALSSDSQQRKIQMSKKSSRKNESLRKIQSRGVQSKRNESIRKNDSIRKEQSPIKLKQTVRKSSKRQSESQNQARIYYDAENPTRMTEMIPEQEKIQLRQVKHSAESKFDIRLEAIPEGDLDQYLAGHFGQLPEIQKVIQLNNREQLYRKLINQLTFCMLLGYEKEILVGLALAFHDRNKADVRKFTIVHFSSYHNEDIKQFLMSTINYIFKKDPCDQIQFHYKFDQSSPQQLSYSTDFNKWFDKYGNVYQKRVDDNIYQRKYVIKRQFNQKCEVVLGGVNKNTFRNLFSVYCGVVMSDSDMIQFKEELRDVITPQNEISYSIAMAQMFRTYLTPDEAEALKGKVKEFAKLKELLILVVMLQKKKVKMDELKLSQYKNLIELNMKLMSQGKDLIRYCKDSGMDLNRIYYAQLSQAFNLPFNFQTTSLPIQSQQTSKIHQISYFRLSPLPPNKLHIIKSSLYNSELHILPTQSTKYKLFVINAQEYNQIKQSNHLDVFMYIRLFLKNVKSHNTASWKYVWLPEMTDKASYSVREFKSFLNKDIYCHDSINISYKQFLPNALIIEPEHKDLVITPPFIVGIMSMALEQITEGSPLYARMIDVPALRTLEIQQ